MQSARYPLVLKTWRGLEVLCGVNGEVPAGKEVVYSGRL